MPDDSPRPSPRVIGAIWLSYFVVSLFGGMLTKDGPMSPDVVGTVSQIVDHTSTYRAGIAVTLFANGLYVVLSALLYRLFAPVNRGVALAAAFLSLTGCVVQIVAAIGQLAPLVIHADPALAASFSAEQIRSAMMAAVGVYRQNFLVSLPMFGMFNLLLGWLIYRSGYVPKVFGILFLIAGAGWVCSLWPPLRVVVQYVGLPAGGLAEIGTTLWLLLKGVDTLKWREAVRSTFTHL